MHPGLDSLHRRHHFCLTQSCVVPVTQHLHAGILQTIRLLSHFELPDSSTSGISLVWRPLLILLYLQC